MERVLIDLESADWGNFIRWHFQMPELKTTIRNFPDGESYIRVEESVKGREVIIVCSLNNPNKKTLELILLCKTLRENGASRVGLIAPYLPYMRQDKQFHPGEGITAEYYASILSDNFNWLITADPHLHRIPKLNNIFTITTRTIHAAPFIADWILKNIKNPVIIGPDHESKQWVKKVANNAHAPYIVLNKLRPGDTEVKETIPDMRKYEGYTPVILDDIISTGKTMINAIKNLVKMRVEPPICIGVHAVFAAGAYEEMMAEGAKEIITCNTIKHSTNKIDISDGLINIL